jgi:tyrosinase
VQAELQLNNSADAGARFVTWAPSPATIRLVNAQGATAPVQLTLRNKPPASGGRVMFRSTATAASTATLLVTLPLDGSAVEFFVAGQFNHPSVSLGDTTIEAGIGATSIGELSLMVRIRKNANKLAPAERDRFVAAFAQLNNQGAGRFADFRSMHTNAGSPEAHGEPGFLPWHRIYLLDLERELQAFDPSVALPYWRFDQAAPALFHRDFLGVSDSMGRVQFSATNPLQFWRTDGVQGINRRPFFVTSSGHADGRTEAQTLALGNSYAPFRLHMEGDPHGSAHVSFGGSISSIPTAARDPLFFLLHANVDRLWAKWQRQNTRFDATAPDAYDSPAGGNRIGHNLSDTMWPWNQVTGAPRPPTAPGGSLADSPCVTAPGPQPVVGSTLDYQGRINAASCLGFDYDDVSFE